MKTVTAKELKELDPRRFNKEYYAWQETATDYEWWEYIFQDFREDMAKRGMVVNDINFSLSYSQGDYAAFDGRMALCEWLEQEQWDENSSYADRWPVLNLTAQNGSIWAFANIKRGWQSSGIEVNSWGQPAGIFSELDEDTWEALAVDQFGNSGIEDDVENWINRQANNLYKNLRDEHGHLTSEEMFIESCSWNYQTFEVEEETV